MNRIGLAFRSFFALLFGGGLPADIVTELGLMVKQAPPPPPPPAPTAADGALYLAGLLQREGRLLDFLMEDIGPYSDEQVGAAARSMHGPCKEAWLRCMPVTPVIDGVEGVFAKPPKNEAKLVKYIGNVPAERPKGGVLRHRGWQAIKVDLPVLSAKVDLSVLAPAELEVE